MQSLIQTNRHGCQSFKIKIEYIFITYSYLIDNLDNNCFHLHLTEDDGKFNHCSSIVQRYLNEYNKNLLLLITQFYQWVRKSNRHSSSHTISTQNVFHLRGYFQIYSPSWKWSTTLSVGLRTVSAPQRGKTPTTKKRDVLSMTLNCICWWDSSYEDLKSVEYSFMAITPRSTQSQSGNISGGQINLF